MKPEDLADLRAIAPSVQLVECKSEDEAIAQVGDLLHASYGYLGATRDPRQVGQIAGGGSSSPALGSSIWSRCPNSSRAASS